MGCSSFSWCIKIVVAVWFAKEVGSVAARFRMNSQCKPPRGNQCIEIRKCPYFEELLGKTRIPRPRMVIKLIREHQCGFHGNTPKVCCTFDSPKTPISKDRPDVISNHPNLRLLPKNCGPISTDFRITSGSKTSIMEFPWMALLAYYTENGIEFRCGGTIIHERYILTAAHCIANMSLVGVRLGEHNINTDADCDVIKGICSPPVQDFYVEGAMTHPQYNPSSFQNDIGLIRLASPANFSFENIQPICLPTGENADTSLDGKFAVVSGWGVTENGYKSAELLKISVPVVPTENCKKQYKNYAKIDDKQICAGGYLGRDSCGGDSGGPLKYVGYIDGVARYVQYGVVSYGPKYCGADGQPGVYTSVAHHTKWILDSMEGVP